MQRTRFHIDVYARVGTLSALGADLPERSKDLVRDIMKLCTSETPLLGMIPLYVFRDKK